MKAVKICKKGIAVVLSVIMMTGLVPVTVQADVSNGTDYSFDSETGELFIHSDSGTTSWREDESISKEAVKSVEFQRRYDASPILNIGAHAFEGCTNLSGTIKLNAQTASIGEDAFKDCNSLETILIPKAVQGQIESAGIPDSTAYVLFEFDGDTLDFSVTDIEYGAQEQIVFDGMIDNGTWGCSGCVLIAEENLKILPSETGNGGRAWYYKYAEDGGIIVTKYTPKVRNGIAEGRTVELPKTLAGYAVNGFSDTAFSDSRLNANQIFIIDDSTNVVLPDSVSKLLITETNGRKEAYFTSGNTGTVDTMNIPIYQDVKTLYAKDMIIDSSSSHMLVMMCSTVSYKENANGDIVITNATFGRFSEEENFTVPTYIKGSPVTTVMINTYGNNEMDKILVDESVNEITYEYRSYSSGSNAPVIMSVTQGSGQKCIEIPTEIAGVAIAEVPETAFDASVICVVVSEDTQANVPSYVSKITYRTDASGNKIITGIVAGTDASGKKIAVSIPATIGGSKPIISEEAQKDMQDIPHHHHYLNGVCTDCGAVDEGTPTAQYPTVYSMNIGTTPLYEVPGGWNSTEGVKVYYGTNRLFHVLGSGIDTQTVSKDAILLNSDSQLEEYSSFSNNGNSWTGSNIQTYLNDTYYNNSLSKVERNAILDTIFIENNTSYAINNANYTDVSSTDKVFVLSAREADELYVDNDSRSCGAHVWLRSSNSVNANEVASVYGNGKIASFDCTNPYIRIRPSFNLDKSAVLFTTAATMDKTAEITKNSTIISDEAYTGDKIWKLTLRDTTKSIKVWQSKWVTMDSDGKVSVPFDYLTTAENEVNQVSVMITDKSYDENAKILYYGKLAITGTTQSYDGIEVFGNGSFVLPESLRNKTLGTDYHMYLLAECINGNTSTDYASSPREITPNDMQDKLISITAPTPIIVANGTTYAAMNLPTQVTIVTERGTVDKADVKWDTTTPESGSYNPSVLTEQSVTLKGAITCPATIDANDVSLTTTITIKISAAGITGAPTANPVAGTYTDNQKVTLTSSTPGAVIYYTTDGTKPSASNGTKYTAPISVTGAEGESVVTTIRAIAVKDGMQNSEIQAFTYIISIPHVHKAYRIIAGANSSWTQNIDGSIVIKGNGDFLKFQAVKVDGMVLDAKNYIAAEGSTIITLKADYLKTLSAGSHTFEIVWTDGSASTNFTIVKNTSDDSNPEDKNDSEDKNSSEDTTKDNQNVTAPQTGDTANPPLWIMLLMASLVGLAGVLIKSKRKDIV